MGYFDKTIKNKSREFILSENHTLKGLEIITNPINDRMVLANITNPYTGLPYDGLLVGGIFAEMDILNNNNRFYSEENYVPFVQELREQIFSTRGVYGCLEHPKNYSTDSNDVSHKIVDIYYNPSDKKVYGLLLILNTPKGRIAQEIFKSGGCLAVSARAGGAEIKQNDGTLKSELKMLITYDLVYHPGFTNAVMDKSIDISKLSNTDFSDGYGTFDNEQLFESKNNNSLFSIVRFEDGSSQLTSEFSKLYESQEEIDEEKMQQNKTADQKQIKKQLSKNVDKQLNENQRKQKVQKILFEANLLNSGKELRKRMNGVYFDNSGGFMKQGLSGISNHSNEI